MMTATHPLTALSVDTSAAAAAAAAAKDARLPVRQSAPEQADCMTSAPATQLANLPGDIVDKIAASLDAPSVVALLRTSNRSLTRMILHEHNPALRSKLLADLYSGKTRPRQISGAAAQGILKALPEVALAVLCPEHVAEVARRIGNHSATWEYAAIIEDDPELLTLNAIRPMNAQCLAFQRYIDAPIYTARTQAMDIWRDVKHLVEHTQGKLQGVFEHLWRNWALLTYLDDAHIPRSPALTFDTLRDEPALHALIKRSPCIDLRMGADIPGLIGHVGTMEMLLKNYGSNVAQLSLNISDSYKDTMPLADRENVLARMGETLAAMHGLRHLVLDQADCIKAADDVDPGHALMAQPACLTHLQSLELTMVFPDTAALRAPFYDCLLTHAHQLSQLTVRGAYLHAELLPKIARLGPRLTRLGLDHLAVSGHSAAVATSEIQHVHLSRPSRCNEDALEAFIHERNRRGRETTIGEM